MKPRIATLLALLLLASACGAPPKTEVTVMDFRTASGVYVLLYSTNLDLRTRFEDHLVADLAARDVRAVASYPDLPDVKASNRENLLAAAKAHKAMFILVVEEVAHDQTGVVRSPRERITHEHPDLHDFYEHTLPADHGHGIEDEVFVEVSSFLIQGDGAKLVWSGTTWAIESDGTGDRVSSLSTAIADAIEEARRQYRSRSY